MARVVASGNLLDCRGNFGSLPRVGNGFGKKWDVTPGHPYDDGGNRVKRVRLTRKTRPGALPLVSPDPGHSTPRRWKRLPPPPPPKSWARGGRASQSFSSLWGWMRFAAGEAWNLPSEGTGLGFWLVSPAEMVGALAPTHVHLVHAR